MSKIKEGDRVKWYGRDPEEGFSYELIGTVTFDWEKNYYRKTVNVTSDCGRNFHELQKWALEVIPEKDMVKVEISRVLCSSGYMPYVIRAIPFAVIKGGGQQYSTITELKKFYKIKKVNKTDRRGWAISSRSGKRHDWVIYEAYITKNYLI